MICLSSSSMSLPRTNPYYQPPKSPKTDEYGPYSGPPKPVPPPLPPNNPTRPFQSSLNLSTMTDPSLVHQASIVPSLRSPPPRPTQLSRSVSYACVPTEYIRSPENKSINPFSSSPSIKKSFNPFLSSYMAPVPPPVSKTWTNPFRAPLCSFPPEDPTDSSRLLGIQLWTELLAASCAVAPNPMCSPCAGNTNNLSDPLTAPPPALPPLRKSSTVAPPVQSTGDKYSALAELDDLFRSTGLDAPTPGGGSVPGPAVPSLLMSEAVNEGCQAWGGRDSPGGVAGGKTSPMWTPQWGTSAVSATQESGTPQD